MKGHKELSPCVQVGAVGRVYVTSDRRGSPLYPAMLGQALGLHWPNSALGRRLLPPPLTAVLLGVWGVRRDPL